MKHTFLLLSLLGLITSVSMRVHAEGSTQVGTAQRLQNTTVIRVDVVHFATETITWTGQGTAQLTSPSNTVVATLSSGQSYQPTAAGTYLVTLSSSQTALWDIAVSNTASGFGRVHATQWDYNTGTFAQSGASSASYYALVPGGAANSDGVVELKLNGLSGNQYTIGANRTGVDGANAGRSVSTSNNAFTPSFEMYLLPPEVGHYNPITPIISDFSYGSGAKGCGLITAGESGTFKFTANVEGTYNLVCDLDNDTVFNRVSPTDLLLVGLTTSGTNSVVWDGKNNAGTNVATGFYNCKVFVNTGELHFVGRDIETSYQGLQLFSVNQALTRAGLAMFWNDTAVQSSDVNQPAPTNAVGVETSGANGVNPGNYASAAVANSTAHSWGNFSSSSKGNNTFVDTFSSLISTASTSLSVHAIATNSDADSDGLSEYVESCTLGTNPNLADTDGDGVSDFVETNGGSPIDTDGTGGIDALDTDSDGDGVGDDVDVNRTNPAVCRDMDGDGCDDCTNVHTGGGSISNDGTDTDADGSCNTGDPDDDGDGVLDGADVAPLDATRCKDVDGDMCDDCSVVHTGGGSVSNDGTDSDGDGSCNTGDADDDNDGVPDNADNMPTNMMRCGDSDADGCDDCSVVSTGGGSAANDGPDFDMDGQCDTGDADDDNDGVADANDSDPHDAHRCKDSDADQCDDCAVTGANGSGGSPSNDGADSDGDGICDLSAKDQDGDGVIDPKDLDIDGDGIPNTDEGTGDKDGDGIDNAHDLDSDGDGISDLIEAGGTDANNDGKVDDQQDANKDGLDDRLASKPLPRPDTDGDGLRDFLDLDSDGDGASDLTEAGGGALDADHDGRVDDKTDDNHNGWSDAIDGDSGLKKPGTALPIPDTDGDGVLDFRDLDSDEDGVPDAIEAHDADHDGKADVEAGTDANGDGWADGYKTSVEPPDTDEDGKPDYRDVDDDGDGRPTADEVRDQESHGADIDGDGIPNYLDGDADGDGASDRDENEQTGDVDEDGTPDYLQPKIYPTDADGDGVLDFKEKSSDDGALDTDGDGIPDVDDDDDDGDGIPTRIERMNGEDTDSDGDGKPDYLDPDDDGDGIPTRDENGDGGADADLDHDGIPNYLDHDSDGDGLLDAQESTQDLNGNGIPDYREPPRVGYAGGAGCAVSGEHADGQALMLLVLGVWLSARKRRSKA